jgi:hypothetical protein
MGPRETVTVGHLSSFRSGLLFRQACILLTRVFADTDRWFALIRIWSPWLAPRQGKSRFELDKQAVMCSFLSLSGKHLVLLAISGVDNVMTVFTSDSEGNVILHVCVGRSITNISL